MSKIIEDGAARADLEHRPDIVHAVLEDDQLYAFKHRQRFGRRPLSRGMVVLLWALRVYVVLMMLLVAFQIYKTMR